MQLWKARDEALDYLEKDRAVVLALIGRLFELIDLTVDEYEKLSSDSSYARVCGLSLLKAKHLGYGTFSLILDGLGQEAGALMRPFIEYTELLAYLRRYPKKADDALNNDLPKAGLRAKDISSIYGNFRSYLNLHASHSSFSTYSLSHLLEPQTSKFKKHQRYVSKVVEKNLLDLSVQLYLLLREAVLTLHPLKIEQFEKLAGQVDEVKAELFSVFKISE